jgi:capsular exopolysaccharide synthesis family protein
MGQTHEAAAVGSNDSARNRTFELRDYLRIIRTYWIGATLFVILSIAVGAAFTMVQPRVYSATASGLVRAPSGDSPGDAYAADSLSKSQAVSYQQLGESLAVADRVSAAMPTHPSPAALVSRVRSVLPDQTAIIEITATGSTPASASTLANDWIAAMAKQVKAIQKTNIVGGSQPTTFSPLAAAPVPTSPVSPDVKATLLIAGLIGLILAFVYALVRNHLDRRIRSALYIEKNFGVPVLGTVPLSTSFTDDSQLLSNQPVDTVKDRHELFALAESLKELRTNLSYVDVDNPPKVIVVTSPQPGDGKSTLAANLAEALAVASAKPVLIIDCDLRRPRVAKIFGLPGSAGLTDVLSGRAELSNLLQQTSKADNLWVLGSGRIPPNPTELLGSRTMKDLLAKLREEVTIVLDAPPILAVTDAVVLSAAADGVLVACSAGTTTYDQLERTIQLLRRGGGNLLGCVLNRVPLRGADARSYGYYGGNYYYKYGAKDPAGTEAPVTAPDAAETPTSRGRRASRQQG